MTIDVKAARRRERRPHPGGAASRARECLEPRWTSGCTAKQRDTAPAGVPGRGIGEGAGAGDHDRARGSGRVVTLLVATSRAQVPTPPRRLPHAKRAAAIERAESHAANALRPCGNPSRRGAPATPPKRSHGHPHGRTADEPDAMALADVERQIEIVVEVFIVAVRGLANVVPRVAGEVPEFQPNSGRCPSAGVTTTAYAATSAASAARSQVGPSMKAAPPVNAATSGRSSNADAIASTQPGAGTQSASKRRINSPAAWSYPAGTRSGNAGFRATHQRGAAVAPQRRRGIR